MRFKVRLFSGGLTHRLCLPKMHYNDTLTRIDGRLSDKIRQTHLPAKLTRLRFSCGATWMSTASGDVEHSSDVCKANRLFGSPPITMYSHHPTCRNKRKQLKTVQQTWCSRWRGWNLYYVHTTFTYNLLYFSIRSPTIVM